MDYVMGELVVLQIFLWAGLGLFWSLRKIRKAKSLAALSGPTHPSSSDEQAFSLFVRPEAVTNEIGIFQSSPVYQYALIEGKHYRFDRLLASGDLVIMERGERCVKPGLVYRECPASSPEQAARL